MEYMENIYCSYIKKFFDNVSNFLFFIIIIIFYYYFGPFLIWNVFSCPEKLAFEGLNKWGVYLKNR